MDVIELRGADAARRFVAQGLWWQRVQPARAATTADALDWALELSGQGEPLPPIGFVADVGQLAFSAHAGLTPGAFQPGWPPALARGYEDHVLGRLLADAAFERAGDALRQYRGRDRARGLAYLLEQMRQRCGLPGVLLSPAVIKTLREGAPDEALREGWESLQQEGPDPLLGTLYQGILAAVRATAAVLGPEDIFELERRTALERFSQRLMLRQVLQAAEALQSALPHQKPRTPGRRYEVPSRLLEEDTYPVGGFSSLSTRGSIESLLHSQLAYMERGERPDLFDVKFLRDELLYYARDENQFLRRRRTFIVALFPDLVETRYKDAELPYQRIVLVLALVLAQLRTLIGWLSTEALVFRFVLVSEKGDSPLAAEKALLELLLAEDVASGVAQVETMTSARLAEAALLAARRSLCHVLLVGTREHALKVDAVCPGRLLVDTAQPALALDRDTPQRVDSAPGLEAWIGVLERWLRDWA